MQIHKPLEISGDDQQGQIRALRSALSAVCAATGSVRTNAALTASKAAHVAYISSFSTEERAVVLAEAQQRDPSVETYEDALHQYGTSLLHELHAAGKLAHV